MPGSSAVGGLCQSQGCSHAAALPGAKAQLWLMVSSEDASCCCQGDCSSTGSGEGDGRSTSLSFSSLASVLAAAFGAIHGTRATPLIFNHGGGVVVRNYFCRLPEKTKQDHLDECPSTKGVQHPCDCCLAPGTSCTN